MATDYLYSLTTDFGNDIENLRSDQLDREIDANPGIAPDCTGILVDGDVITISFDAALSAGEQTTLDGVVAAHTPIPIVTTYMYDAIVDKTGDTGTYMSVREAVDAGAVSIYVRSGLYVETGNIYMPDNFNLMGEDKNNTVIIFNYAPYGFVVDGGADIENSGTVSYTNTSKTVVGVGTSFTNLSVNDYISLGNTFHQIASIESDTSMTLKKEYWGSSQSTQSYKATTLSTGSFSNFSIAYSSSSLISLKKAINVSLTNIGMGLGVNGLKMEDCAQILFGTSVVYNCTNGINLLNCDEVNLTQLVNKNNSETCLLIASSNNIVIDGMNISNSGGDGIKIVDGGQNIQITDTSSSFNNGAGLNADSDGGVTIQSCTFSGNGTTGFQNSGTGSFSIGGCVANDNVDCGMHLTSTSVLAGCVCNNNFDAGIKFQSATNCSLSACSASSNEGDGISFDANSDECILTGCQVNDNGGTGIDILGTDTMISHCVVRRNTTAQITDGGTTTTLTSNKT